MGLHCRGQGQLAECAHCVPPVCLWMEHTQHYGQTSGMVDRKDWFRGLASKNTTMRCYPFKGQTLSGATVP